LKYARKPFSTRVLSFLKVLRQFEDFFWLLDLYAECCFSLSFYLKFSIGPMGLSRCMAIYIESFGKVSSDFDEGGFCLWQEVTLCTSKEGS
jgi:hypothetical protein